jgi:hypothetical protein
MELTHQYVLTVSAGKRLIGKGLAAHPAIQAVLQKGTLVIIAGTTNAYVAQEILRLCQQEEGFRFQGFRRGMTVPPGLALEKQEFPGDVILVNGQLQRGKTIFDVTDSLGAGDVVLKGGNAVNVAQRVAGVLIGDRKAGTVGASVGPAVGRKVRLIVPIGLEKRVIEPINDLATLANSPTTKGPGLLPIPGEPFTELDAIATLTGAAARLLAAGGTCGAEGAVYLAVTGSSAQVEKADKLMAAVVGEGPYSS